jgi:hypothetical protein
MSLLVSVHAILRDSLWFGDLREPTQNRTDNHLKRCISSMLISPAPEQAGDRDHRQDEPH